MRQMRVFRIHMKTMHYFFLVNEWNKNSYSWVKNKSQASFFSRSMLEARSSCFAPVTNERVTNEWVTNESRIDESRMIESRMNVPTARRRLEARSSCFKRYQWQWVSHEGVSHEWVSHEWVSHKWASHEWVSYKGVSHEWMHLQEEEGWGSVGLFPYPASSHVNTSRMSEYVTNERYNTSRMSDTSESREGES